ncbi:hybrid sensor histidine kinase/response regulator [Tenacibaculum sp. Bg11-29]|uniref:ATP-binding response regulator n=1 Tax=Tenacibaculum sp. Bg11-29 TaxID=2058306 RepID=UPI000C34D9F5|nr:ATP-binding protein [Tenacibaculum sp. Bg11-29]PKH49330.1 hybrid sensor histidine kinase/response regulator [Tenacibaculum sp. Bg11-29]
MKSSKQKIAFKVLIGYLILGVLATISGGLLLSEIKTFTKLQRQGVLDGKKIIQTGSLIAKVYENENLGRAAIQLNSTKRFKEYVYENKQLLLKIDSLNFIVNNGSQKFILDSIKLVLTRKRKNITGLKRLKLQKNSDESINEALDKLGSIDLLLGGGSVKKIVENSSFLDEKTLKNLEEYLHTINQQDANVNINKVDQKQIDSLVSISKNILKKAQRETNNKRRSLRAKERVLIKNDLIISRKLREMLNVLEKDVIIYTKNIYKEREETLNRSKNIILFAAAIGFIIILLFSFIILDDFWKSQHYRKELEQANSIASSLLNSREQLMFMVSHDLRTPLSTIIGYSELLQKEAQNVKEKNYIEHIQNASVYMRQLVADLLEFSKLESGEVGVESISFDLKKYLTEVVDNTENLVKDKPVSVILKHDETIASPIISDPFRIKQILYNLVTNASKFTEEGFITINSSIEKENAKTYLKIIVSDTGVGIDKDQQQNVFKAFTQIETGSNDRNGFGLGLTISNRLAELLGGKLTLSSNLGEGSVFTLKIPVAFSEESLHESSISNEGAVFSLKAIVVEDDVAMGTLLKEKLEQLGVKVYLFNNAQTALKSVSEIYYDLVLTDIQLPKMNGFHFMETLKNHDSYSNQPIIAMTGRTSLSMKEYVKAGFSDVLIKPFHLNKLESILQKYFSSCILKPNSISEIENKVKETSFFDVVSLGAFLDNDALLIQSTLSLFLKETQNDFLLLEKAQINNDLKIFNDVSHKMISMFRQINAVTLVPFLEVFETGEKIDSILFADFKKIFNEFILELENYLS